MATVRDILAALEVIAPKRFTFPFDKVGLQVGDENQKVERAVVSLDRSLGAVRFGVEQKAQLLLAHHPLIFTPISSVDTRSHTGKTILSLAQNDVSFIAAHTNWDSARGGINDKLCEMFGLKNVKDFGMASDVKGLKMVVLCPPDHADAIIDAASTAGAGIIGEYTRCAFRHEGEGTFIGSANSNPFVGKAGDKEEVKETRIEMYLEAVKQATVERAVRKAHPYEEPAIEFFVLADRGEQPAGRLGELAEPVTLGDFKATINQVLSTESMVWGDPAKKIKRIAIVGGAADSEWMPAQRANADLFLTGEVKQHVALESSESGLPLVAAGHYATEHPGCDALRERMAAALPEIEWILFEPKPGWSGRPL